MVLPVSRIFVTPFILAVVLLCFLLMPFALEAFTPGLPSDVNFLAARGTQGLDAGELQWPNEIPIGPDGDLFVVEGSNAQVQRFEPQSAVQQILDAATDQTQPLPELRLGSYTLTQTLPSGWFLHNESCDASVLRVPIEGDLSVVSDYQETNCTVTVGDELSNTVTPTVTATSTSTPMPASTPMPSPTHTVATSDGETLFREAESGVIPPDSVLQKLADTNASGGLYVAAPAGSDDASRLVENNRIDFTFSITQPGTYKLNARIQAGPSQDSYYVKIDDAPDSGYTWYMSHSSGYKYDDVNAHEVGDPYTINLSSGTHTVSFYHRDSGARLDTIELVLVAPSTPTPSTPTPDTPTPDTPTPDTPTPNTPTPDTPTPDTPTPNTPAPNTPAPNTPAPTPSPSLSSLSVMGGDGLPVAGARVFADGQMLGETDLDGRFGSSILPADLALVALSQQAEFGTAREFHDGWAYRAYQTNIQIEQDGSPSLYTSTGEGMQTLSVSTTNALILFNLVVSIEWDATEAYLADVADAIQKAADLLYDATDGQISFEQVTIYDNAQAWTSADIQISAKNVVHPHAFVNGVTDTDISHLIRVGRAWDGFSGAKGNWSNSEGYQTLVHEFGHYALGLYDEYFGYNEIDGQLAGRTEAFCTGPRNREGDPDSTNASIMDYHYAASELADNGRWTEWCQKTAQHLLNDGQSDWQTILTTFADVSDTDSEDTDSEDTDSEDTDSEDTDSEDTDSEDADEASADRQVRWQLISPDVRAGVGNAVPGPYAIPNALPIPVITINNEGADPTPFMAQICYNGQPYRQGAWVTLTKANGTAMDQGLTSNLGGELDILGGKSGDSIHVVSINGVLAGSGLVDDIQSTGALSIQAISKQVSGLASAHLAAEAGGVVGIGSAEKLPPFVRLWPTTSGGFVDGVRMVVDRTAAVDSLTYVLTGPDDIGPSAAIPYDEGEGSHSVQIGFVPVGNAGFAKAQGSYQGRFIELNVDYRQQQATQGAETDLFSNDGNLMLHLERDAFASEQLAFLIASPWGLPGTAPTGQTIVGEIYDITAAQNVRQLAKPSVLRLHYDIQGVADQNLHSPSIYHWNFLDATWVPVASNHDSERQEVVASITELGIYALMASVDAVASASASPNQDQPNACASGEFPGDESPASTTSIYLPLVNQ